MSESPVRAAPLGKAAARGMMTLGVAAMADQGAQFLRAIVLARLLSPTDFGLMGMAFIAIRAGEMLSQTGFSRALVQKQGDVSGYLDTVWVVSVLRGALLFAVAWVLSPLAGRFFETPEVVPVLRYVSVALLIQGFVNPALFLLERDLRFKRQAVPSVSCSLADLITAVAFALVLRNVWAMVYGFIVGKLVYVTASFVVRPYLPRLRARWAQFREFYGYGKHVFRGSAVNYVVSQLDRLLIGRFLGAEELGLYSVAWRVASMPATGLYNVVFRVAFPVFSRIQAESSRLREGFLRALQLMGLVAAPIAGGLYAVAPDFVPVVLGAKWLPVIPTFRALCLAGGCLSLCYLIRSVLSAVGRPDLAAQSAYLFLAAVGIPIYPALRQWGNLGAAVCMAAASLVCLAHLLVVSNRVLGGILGDASRVLMAPILGSLGMSAGVLALRAGVPLGPRALALALQVLAGVALYALLAGGLDRLAGGALARSLRGLVRPM